MSGCAIRQRCAFSHRCEAELIVAVLQGLASGVIREFLSGTQSDGLLLRVIYVRKCRGFVVHSRWVCHFRSVILADFLHGDIRLQAAVLIGHLYGHAVRCAGVGYTLLCRISRILFRNLVLVCSRLGVFDIAKGFFDFRLGVYFQLRNLHAVHNSGILWHRTSVVQWTQNEPEFRVLQIFHIPCGCAGCGFEILLNLQGLGTLQCGGVCLINIGVIYHCGILAGNGSLCIYSAVVVRSGLTAFTGIPLCSASGEMLRLCLGYGVLGSAIHTVNLQGLIVL